MNVNKIIIDYRRNPSRSYGWDNWLIRFNPDERPAYKNSYFYKVAFYNGEIKFDHQIAWVSVQETRKNRLDFLYCEHIAKDVIAPVVIEKRGDIESINDELRELGYTVEE